MKTLPMIFAIALMAASPTLAFAQGDTATKPGTGLDADKNPSGLHANPAAGNPAGTKWAKHGKKAMIQPKKQKAMKTSPVSATRHHKATKMGTGKATETSK